MSMSKRLCGTIFGILGLAFLPACGAVADSEESIATTVEELGCGHPGSPGHHHPHPPGHHPHPPGHHHPPAPPPPPPPPPKPAKPIATAHKYLELDLPFPAGVAGDEEVVFIGSPFEGRVVAYSRKNRKLLGDLPTPPGGFQLPFIMKSVQNDRVAVLDAGGFPDPTSGIPTVPVVYEYTYTLGKKDSFQATLVRSIAFDAGPIGFAEDALQLDDGRYLLTDAVLGSIWVADGPGNVRLVLGPEDLDLANAIPETAFCPTMPLIYVQGIPFLFTDSTIPGIAGLAARNGMLYFSSPCAGAVFSIPLDSLFDDRLPHERAADIQLVSPKPSHIAVEQLLNITFNPFEPDEPYLYAADSLQLQVIRIDIRTGERQVVANDPKLLNFPSSLAFVPGPGKGKGKGGPSTLLVVSNQQHRNPLLNDAISEPIIQEPYLATEIKILPTPHGHH